MLMDVCLRHIHLWVCFTLLFSHCQFAYLLSTVKRINVFSGNLSISAGEGSD